MAAAIGPIGPKWNEHPRLAWIWPSDKKQKGKWPYFRTGRIKDLLTCKGPDIYVGDRRSTAPHRPHWSNWREFDNLGYFTRDEGVPDWIGNMHPDMVYDFRTRKYKKAARPWHWSDAKWGPNGQQWYRRAAWGEPIAEGYPDIEYEGDNPYINRFDYPFHGESAWANWVPWQDR
ncbi:MAG: hypothetical protein FRX48_03905 [Lasallia pustulata]|uniref:Uncharacterized protein n=1 Tax=Lasallia pustulata TaxID=136370 RepID=A0A5M8PV86_9LECA|nr:MAG: hypothetical protein FRX48_03905 [Lasallia pustulata]